MGTRTFWGLLVSAVFVVSCSRPVVSGRVVDVFGEPVAGATMTIEGTSFSTTSDSRGEYTVSFVPGQFKLRAKKDGYTSRTVPFSVAQATRVPASDVVLYPRPEEAGIYFIGKGELDKLAQGRLQRMEERNPNPFLPGTTNWELPAPTTLAVTEGHVAFIDMMPSSVEVARFSEYFRLELQDSNGSTPGFIASKLEKIGDEELPVRRISLHHGDYGWVELGQNLLGQMVPTGKYWGFHVGQVVEGTVIAPDVVRSKNGLVISVEAAGDGGAPFFGFGHHGEWDWDWRVGDEVFVAGKMSLIPPEKSKATAPGSEPPTHEVGADWVLIKTRK